MDGVISISLVNVHSERSIASEQVTQAILGTPVSVDERVEGWSRITMPDNYSGWVEDNYLIVEKKYPKMSKVAVITDLYANLRVKKLYSSASLALAPMSSVLEFIGQEEEWLEIRLPDGRSCWVEEKRALVRNIDEALEPPTREGVLQTAKRMLGVPYLWGGTTPLGIDCSGFVQLVYKMNGLLLERDASPQAEQGDPVDLENLQMGDLVFFGDKTKPGVEGITHVGMAIGDGNFIHASGGDYVRINPLKGSSYEENVIRARTYIK